MQGSYITTSVTSTINVRFLFSACQGSNHVIVYPCHAKHDCAHITNDFMCYHIKVHVTLYFPIYHVMVHVTIMSQIIPCYSQLGSQYVHYHVLPIISR